MRGALLLLMLWYGAALRAEAAGGNGMQPAGAGEADGTPLDCLPAASPAPRVRGGASTSACAASPDEVIEWHDWDASVFEQARREHKLVLLNLEAVWCHWCHVMAERTYARADIQRFITAHFIAVKVDQDARPDLATRYRDYGWPATIVLDADGNDIAKRAGYIAPEAMSALLAAVHSDPTPEPAARPFDPGVPSTSPLLTEALRAELRARHARAFDDARGGLRTMQKYLDRDSVEWSLVLAAGGDANEAAMARRTLDAARALLKRTPGVERVLDRADQRELGLDHERAGDLIAIADARSWFTYYYWLDDARAPEFARCVDIHRKCGYDPVELFLDPALRFPKLKIAFKLLRKKLGLRMKMDVIPLDASLVRGSHGRVPEDREDWPVLIGAETTAEMAPLTATAVHGELLRLCREG